MKLNFVLMRTRVEYSIVEKHDLFLCTVRHLGLTEKEVSSCGTPWSGMDSVLIEITTHCFGHTQPHTVCFALVSCRRVCRET